MSIRIEIQEQPERQRFWAEVEVGGMVARRRLVHSPHADGLDGILAAVRAAYEEIVPRPKVVAPEVPEVAPAASVEDGGPDMAAFEESRRELLALAAENRAAWAVPQSPPDAYAPRYFVGDVEVDGSLPSPAELDHLQPPSLPPRRGPGRPPKVRDGG